MSGAPRTAPSKSQQYKRLLEPGQAGRRRAERRPASLYSCSLMRRDSDDRTTVLAAQSHAADRRRRLHRGADLWNQDRLLSAERTRRVALLTLTFAQDDYE